MCRGALSSCGGSSDRAAGGVSPAARSRLQLRQEWLRGAGRGAPGSVGGGELPRSLPVEVVAATVSGHEQTVIKSHTPQEVTVLPWENGPEESKPATKKQ